MCAAYYHTDKMTGVTKELVMLYFKDQCLPEDDTLVENWLRSDILNTQQTMIWIGEIEDQDEKLFIELCLSRNEVWRKMSERVRQDLAHANAGQVKSLHEYKSGRIKTLEGWYRVTAACFIFVALAFGLYLWKYDRLIENSTRFGQIKHLVLPDNSKITLNGNSSLTYSKSWNDQRTREVWLKGEAFFEITHLRNNGRFLVHLSNNKTVEVLGTEFDISERGDKSLISLKSGKIKLTLPEKIEEEDIYLKPGDLVEVTAQESNTNKVKRSRVNPELYYGWILGKWILDATSLNEMLQKLEESYGVVVKVENQKLLARQVSGSIPLKEGDGDMLISNIANLFDLKVIKKDNVILLAE